MTTSTSPKVPTAVLVETQTETLDEARWQAWLRRGRANDARSKKMMRVVGVAALLAATAFAARHFLT